MDSSFIRNKNIYDTLRHEWNQIDLWRDFISSKDLGICFMTFVGDTYVITDHKKWMLAKLKYGF
jgi:hypothetical protein